jgi:uncharacterized protein (TIGR02001 family)
MRLTIGVLALLLAGTVGARAELSFAGLPLTGSVTLASDYIYHGLSQTGGTGALQAGLMLGEEEGPYLNLWASRVRYAGYDSFAELDLTTGWQKRFGDWRVDGALELVFYPDSHGNVPLDYTTLQVTARREWQGLWLDLSLGCSPGLVADSGAWVGGGLGATLPLTEALSATARLGYQASNDPRAQGLPDYYDGKLGLAYTIAHIDFEAFASWTSVPDALCPDRRCGPAVTIATTFRY